MTDSKPLGMMNERVEDALMTALQDEFRSWVYAHPNGFIFDWTVATTNVYSAIEAHLATEEGQP
jgi:hypothetical protein